ncbi:MAG: PH domain-containing protein [Chloroflexi bacterium]|nr:MAG: PH domain-containing protein [Chloroflexota bacterium]TMF65500.1 MAG: PH domain-containing protein [Chloroflexota bacterium]
MAAGPGDLILEPNEQVILATRPLFLWEPLVLIEVVLVVLTLYFVGIGNATLVGLGLVSFVLLTIWIVVRWIPWSAKWFVLTDRRLISRWGVFNKNQSALLLDRVQDASLARPFPLSLIRDYGVLRLESAGMHSEERITEGLHELAMTRATAFYRALNDAQTPGR